MLTKKPVRFQPSTGRPPICSQVHGNFSNPGSTGPQSLEKHTHEFAFVSTHILGHACDNLSRNRRKTMAKLHKQYPHILEAKQREAGPPSQMLQVFRPRHMPLRSSNVLLTFKSYNRPNVALQVKVCLQLHIGTYTLLKCSAQKQTHQSKMPASVGVADQDIKTLGMPSHWHPTPKLTPFQQGDL